MSGMHEDGWVDTSTVAHVDMWVNAHGESGVSGGVRVGDDSLHWVQRPWRVAADVSTVRLRGVTASGGCGHGVLAAG